MATPLPAKNQKCPLKEAGWKTTFLFEMAPSFSRHVSNSEVYLTQLKTHHLGGFRWELIPLGGGFKYLYGEDFQFD